MVRVNEDCWNSIEGYIRIFTFDLLDVKSYVIVDNLKALVIDPCDNEQLYDYLESQSVNEVVILLTHEHYDHFTGLSGLRKRFGCTVICSLIAGKYITDAKKNLSYYGAYITEALEKTNRNSSNMYIKPFVESADIVFQEYYEFGFKGYNFFLYSTPGHSPGSSCILCKDKYNVPLAVFSGDSLMLDYPTHTNLPGGRIKDFLSITKPFLQSLPHDIYLFPGHGSACKLKEALANLDNINGKMAWH